MSDGTEDLVLAHLIEITRASIIEKRPVFSNLMEEPIFYRRHFVRWVIEAISEKNVADNAIKEGIKSAFQ